MADPTYTQQTRTDGNGNPYSVSIPSAPVNQVSPGVYSSTPGTVSTPPPATPPPTTPSTVPTTAPPVSTPTAVFSPSPALDQIQQIKDKMASVNQQIVDRKAQLAPNIGKPGFDANGEAIPGYVAPSTPPPPKTIDQHITDSPDLGNQFIHSISSGETTQNPLNQPIPPGWTNISPSTGPKIAVTDTTTDGTNTYKQYSDGTYGKYDASGAYIGPASQLDWQTNKAGQALLASLQQVINQTIPLTATQQALADGLTAKFKLAIQQQQTANANLTGAMSVFQMLHGGGGQIDAVGAIQGTVNAGVAKIADLNSQLSSELAKMTQGFMTDDYNMIKGSYDAYNAANDKKQTELDKINEAAALAIKNKNEELDRQRTYNLDVSKLNEQIGQNQFTQQLDIKKFNEVVKSDAFDRAYKLEDLALKRQNNQLLSTPPVVVPTGPDGKPDPAKQQQFLAALPGGENGATAIGVKGLATYDLLPSHFATRSTNGGPSQQQQFEAMAKQYDSSYSDIEAPARQKFLINVKSGPISQGLVSANKAINHLTIFANSVSALNNGTVANSLNAAENAAAAHNIFSTPAKRTAIQSNIGEADTNSLGVKDELAKFFRGTGTADVKSIDDWSKRLDSNSTPGDLRGTVQGGIDLFAGQINVLNQQFSTNMGKPYNSAVFLQPETLSKLSALKDQGYKVDIPGVPFTNTLVYLHSGGTSEDLDKARAKLILAGNPVTSENILQAAQLNQ